MTFKQEYLDRNVLFLLKKPFLNGLLFLFELKKTCAIDYLSKTFIIFNYFYFLKLKLSLNFYFVPDVHGTQGILLIGGI
jgi:hypothetical protein